MKESNVVQRSVAFMVGAVGVWWVANTIATIASKSVMRGGDEHKEKDGLVGFTAAFADWRWVELTLLQHLMGAVLAGILVKISRKSIWPTHTRDQVILICVAALGNVVGNMSTNAAYSLVTSSTAQVIKACEPLFTFVLTLLLYRDYTSLDASTFLSVVIIVVGAGSFLLGDATFNVWGMVAAMISNTAFPTRNIFLKKLSDSWENPLQKFTVMSIYSTLLALPLWLVKVVMVSGFSTGKMSESLISSFFHSTYNLASITVLEGVNPVTHAILNISKRLFVIMANVIYFHVPFSFHMFLSLVLLLVGCYLYQMKSGSTTRVVAMKCFLLASFMVYIFIPSSHISLFPASGDERVRYNRISTAWIYDKPIPESVVSNIELLAEQNPEMVVYVYCGTTRCVDRIEKTKNKLIVGEFAILPTILSGLPLRGWLAQHTFNKVIAGKDFEDHVQDAVALGLLWKYGGFYINPRYRVAGKLAYPECMEDRSSSWVSKVRAETELFSGAYFSRLHSLIYGLADLFVSEYPTKVNQMTMFNFDFRSRAWPLVKGHSNSELDSVKFNLSVSQSSLSNVNHFGTLSFSRRVSFSIGANLGDQVQGFPGLAYLPFRDKFLDRDALVNYTDKDNVTSFLNAWWGDGTGSWPPPKTVQPIMLSIHLSSKMADKWVNNPEYLREREPIGCRDVSTLKLLTKHRIKAYFSGCMTLQMPNPFFNVKRNGKIYIVDLKEQYFNMLPPDIQKKGIKVKHDWVDRKANIEARFTQAYGLMKKYSEAKLVITQRIHGALPCVGMNTPVVFFNTAAMPGDGGQNVKGSSRAAGLTPLFHTIDFYELSEADRVRWIAEFPWDNPPPNPNPSMMMQLRASAWNVIRRHQPLYDSGRKFGVIPMSPPIMAPQCHFVFHIVLTKNTGMLTRQQWRSIESVFYHHPTSELLVHSHNLRRDTFNVLTEAGYLIKLANIDLEGLLTGSPAEDGMRNLENAQRSDDWSNHEAELLRLLILYQQGGVYLDNDVILARTIDTLTSNSLGWKDSTNSSLGTSFMMFEKGHPYLKLCLSEFVKAYGTGDLAVSTSSDILTRVWHQYRSAIHVLPHYSFYSVICSKSQAQQCFEDTTGQAFHETIETITTKAYAVKLNSEFIAGAS